VPGAKIAQPRPPSAGRGAAHMTAAAVRVQPSSGLDDALSGGLSIKGAAERNRQNPSPPAPRTISLLDRMQGGDRAEGKWREREKVYP
jgi:hypothetical protein